MQISLRPSTARLAAGLGACLLFGLSAGLSTAADLASLSRSDAAGGLRAALGKGVDTAVAHLGAPGGFLDDDKLRIPLPPALERVERRLRMVGMSGEADELKVAMNHAAEAAVADSKPVLVGALYDRFAGKASELGLLSGESADLDDFVTSKALDGLFSVIADEEHAIRQNPLAAGSALINTVFGAL